MKSILKIYVRFCLFLLPVVFLPVVNDPYGFGKMWLLVGSMLVGVLFWLVDIFLIRKKMQVKLGKAFGAMTLMLVWGVVSWLRESTGVRMQSLMSGEGVATLFGLWGWMFLWLQVASDEEKEKQINWLTVSGVLVGIASIVAFVIPTKRLPLAWPANNPLVVISGGWSVTGSVLSEVILLTYLGLEWGRRLGKKLKDGEYMGEALMVAVMLLVVALDVFKVVRLGWVSLDANSGWIVAVESFKRNPIWGVGIGNFARAFDMYRPASYNLTGFWSGGFSTSTNGLLQLWTELGLVGLLLGGVILTMWLKMNKRKFDFYALGLLGLAAMFLPASLVGQIILVWVLVRVSKEERKYELERSDKLVKVVSAVLALVMVVSVALSGYWWGKILAADIYMKKSVVAAGKNDGGSTYNLQIKAIALNPYSGEYRRVYSQTNMALAKVLLADKDINEEDKQKASILIQQAVREGKNAIALEGTNPNYWLNLAGIYKQLIGVVDGSADWAYQSYQQAAMLDPVNPNTGMDLGGLLFAAGKYEEADRVFEQTVVNKKDMANAWYNWAYTAKKAGRIQEAVGRLTQALTLVSVDSSDYDRASEELASWKKELDTELEKQKVLPTPTPTAEILKTADPLPVESSGSGVKVTPTEMMPPKE